MKTTFFDRLIDRLDRLDPSSVQSVVLKLAREKGFLETVFNTIQEGIIVIDRDARIHYVNLAARSMLGIPEDAEGSSLDRFVRDVDWHGLFEADANEWQRVSYQEVEVFYPRHRLLTFYIVPHEETESRDEIPMATIIFHDATESRRDTHETIQSEKVEAITKLAAGVAHEIGNPLNSLNIHLQLLACRMSELGDDEAAKESGELVDVAIQEVNRLDSIVNNFLRAIRPSKPDMKRIQISDVLASTLKFMRPEIENRGIRVEASLEDELPVIQGDPAQLRQAFYNILRNSVQAMPDGGLIQITTRVSTDFLEIRFTDTGKGISAEDMSRIMEPYYTTRSDGTGLGLLVVERVLRDHGAEFGIDSSEEGGTVFTVRLPLRERQTRLLQAPRPEENENAG